MRGTSKEYEIHSGRRLVSTRFSVSPLQAAIPELKLNGAVQYAGVGEAPKAHTAQLERLNHGVQAGLRGRLQGGAKRELRERRGRANHADHDHGEPPVGANPDHRSRSFQGWRPGLLLRTLPR